MKNKNYFQLMKMACLAMAVLFCVSASAAIRYVKSTTDSPTAWSEQTNVYTDFSTAYAAAAAGDEIWVAAGTYPIATGSAFKGVKIYGGFKGTETTAGQRTKVENGRAWEFENETTFKLSTNLNFANDYQSGIFAVQKSSGTTNIGTGAIDFLVDGIIFDGDNKTGRALNIGGHSANATVNVTKCIIQNFNSGADGGGLNFRSAGVTVSYCLIQNNKGNKGGGGYFEQTIVHHCDVIGNSALQTGSVTDYQGNQNGGGGGLFLASSGANATYHTTAYNCYIADNTAAFGGGIHIRGQAWAYNCIIVNNTTGKSGSGVCFEGRDSNAAVYNCIIANNTSSLAGGAGVVLASTANSNTAASPNVKVHTLRNSILYNNTDVTTAVVNIGSAVTAGSVTPTITNNILDKTYASPLAGTNNITETDPAKLFTNITSGNYTPPANFTGINQGSNTPALTFAENIDYADVPRIQGASIDIGVYEFTPTAQPVYITETNVTVTNLVTEATTGGNLTIEFTVNTGYHSPYVSVNGVKTNVTEGSGIYTLEIENVTATQNINITAFAANVLPVSDDTYQRYSGATGYISGYYKNETTLECRGNYAAIPLLQFTPTAAMTTAGYDYAELKLVPTTTRGSLNYDVRQFPNDFENIHEVGNGDVAAVRAGAAVGEQQTTALTGGTPIIFNVTDDYILNFPADIILVIVKLPTSEGNIDRFHSLENGNAEYVPQLVFSTKVPTGKTDIITNEPIVSIKYYTLQGVEVAKPAIGSTCIVKTIYQSGKSSSKKVMSFE